MLYLVVAVLLAEDQEERDRASPPAQLDSSFMPHIKSSHAQPFDKGGIIHPKRMEALMLLNRAPHKVQPWPVI